IPGAAIAGTVDTSILGALATLRGRGHFGPYCVVLSTDLHQAAFTPVANTGIPLIGPILGQLRPDGVQFSHCLPAGPGVVFSTGRVAIDLVIPWDLHVECQTVAGNVTFLVIEQFRLRINDRNATVALA